MKEQIIEVTKDDIVSQADGFKAQGYRFVTMTCTELDETTLDILYHFEKDYELTHLRLSTKKDETVPSITSVYLGAFLIENEMQDQFGAKFDGIAIDFGGTLYLEDEYTNTTPFCRYSVVDKGDKKASEQG